jgi:hypothetical protein
MVIEPPLLFWFCLRTYANPFSLQCLRTQLKWVLRSCFPAPLLCHNATYELAAPLPWKRYTHIHTYTHTSAQTHAEARKQIRTRTYTDTYIHTHTHTHTHKHTHMQTHTHIQTHTHTLTHTHTRTQNVGMRMPGAIVSKSGETPPQRSFVMQTLMRTDKPTRRTLK